MRDDLRGVGGYDRTHKLQVAKTRSSPGGSYELVGPVHDAKKAEPMRERPFPRCDASEAGAILTHA